MSLTHKRFREIAPLEKRKEVVSTLARKYPHCVPVMVEYVGCKIRKDASNKYLVAADYPLTALIPKIRKCIELSAGESIFIFANKSLLSISTNMSLIYNQHKDDDGFLYLTVCKENSFGG